MPKGPLPAASETSCPEFLLDDHYLSMYCSSNSLYAQGMHSAQCTTCSICSAEGGPAPTEAITDHPSQAAAPGVADSNSTAEAEPVTGIPLSVPFQLRSADGLQTPFTNYVRGYSGLLDYIWFEPSRLKVERAIPLPSLEEVQGYLPSQRFPSDHLSVSHLCCYRRDRSHSLCPHHSFPLVQIDTRGSGMGGGGGGSLGGQGRGGSAAIYPFTQQLCLCDCMQCPFG